MSLFALIGSLGFIPGVMQELPTLSFASFDATMWGVLLFGIFGISFLAYGLSTYGLSKISGEEVGLFVYIDPIATVLLAIPLLGELPGPSFILGGVLVFGGIYIAERRIHWHPLHKLRD